MNSLSVVLPHTSEQDHVLRALCIATLKLTCEGRESELLELLEVIRALPPETKSEMMRFALSHLKNHPHWVTGET